MMVLATLLLFYYFFAENPNPPPDQHITVIEGTIYLLYSVSGEGIRRLHSSDGEKKQSFGGQKKSDFDLTTITLQINFLTFFLILNTLIALFYVRYLKRRIYVMDQKIDEFTLHIQQSTEPAIRQNESPKILRNSLEKQSETPVEPSLTLYMRIIELIQAEKLFLDPNLNQQLICKKLATNKTFVYEAIRKYSTLNFKGLINHFRVEEAQRIIQQLVLEEKDLNYDTLMQLSGFNSKTSFYRIYKAHVGLSPKEFEDKIRSQRSIDLLQGES